MQTNRQIRHIKQILGIIKVFSSIKIRVLVYFVVSCLY